MFILPIAGGEIRSVKKFEENIEILPQKMEENFYEGIEIQKSIFNFLEKFVLNLLRKGNSVNKINDELKKLKSKSNCGSEFLIYQYSEFYVMVNEICYWGPSVLKIYQRHNKEFRRIFSSDCSYSNYISTSSGIQILFFLTDSDGAIFGLKSEGFNCGVPTSSIYIFRLKLKDFKVEKIFIEEHLPGLETDFDENTRILKVTYCLNEVGKYPIDCNRKKITYYKIEKDVIFMSEKTMEE